MALARLLISKLGPMGDGIHQGRRERVYLDRGLPGDEVRARIKTDSFGVARGEILEFIEASQFRQVAPCEHFDYCGNCTLQHAKENFYRRWKIDLVKEFFKKQGLEPRQWKEPVFVGNYERRRVTFSALKQANNLTVGYYKRRSKEIHTIDSCLIAHPHLLAIREKIQPYLKTILSSGKPVDIFLQKLGESGDMVFTGPLGSTGKPEEKVLQVLKEFFKVCPLVSRVSWRSDERAEIKTLISRGAMTASFGNLKVNLPPAAFLQPTASGEKALVEGVMKALPERGKFADLFSGCGTFAGSMLKKGSVDAYESVPQAIAALKNADGENAKALKTFRRNLFTNPLRRDEINRYDAVVFDPPRAGCPEQAMQMAGSKCKTLIGVSCNPLTFARDAAILCERGHRLQSLQVVDQFMWSHHVEVIGVFTR